MKNKKGLTLAEVLITLAIVGVVAAITISNVINKYQEKYLQRRFDKAFNTFSQAIQKSYADLGYIPNCSYYINSGNYFDGCIELNNKLLDNLKIVKRCLAGKESAECTDHIRGTDTAGGSVSYNGTHEWRIHEKTTFFLNDGTMYIQDASMPFFIIDTNGKKGPNKWGYDLFIFWIAWNKFQCYSGFTEPGGIACSDRLLKIGR